MLATLLAGIGARDQAIVGAMAIMQPGRMALVWIAVLSALACSVLAGTAAWLIVPQLAPDAREMLAAMALGLAGFESLITSPARRPVEPTHSLGAFAIVIFASQLADAARFLVFAMAVAFAGPVSAAAGGAAGGAAVVALAWTLPDRTADPAMLRARRVVGIALIGVALVLARDALP